MKRALVLLVALVSSAAHAATFVVPTDAGLVRESEAIVVATAGASHARWSAGGWIETVTPMRVIDAIKGPFHPGDTFDVVELGGIIGDIGYAVPGSPSYAAGDRLLLFAEAGRGAWVTRSMAIGAFAFVADTKGRELLVRDSQELRGWDTDGRRHREPMRLAAPFVDYVRAVARGSEPAADYIVRDPVALSSRRAVSLATGGIGGYLIQSSGGMGIRWPSFPVVFRSNGSQPGAAGGGVNSLQKGLAAWTNDAGSSIVMQYGGTTSIAKTGLNGGSTDGVNVAAFNDPSNEISGTFNGAGVLAIGGAWFGTQTHTFGGETFLTIVEADLVVQDGIFGAGLTGNGFDHVLAHELGHCLGFRHSDKDGSDGPCGAPLSCTSDALMNSTVNFNADPTGASLQAWDMEAASAVYGSGTPIPVCTPPAISVQPKSIDLPLNADVVLSVTATGDTPLSYQWFVGTKGNVAAPVQGGSTPQISVRPATTTNYWVRVSNKCGSADSNAATVTVNGCPAVSINSFSPSTSVLQGKSTTLSVSATTGGELQYQWYYGTSGSSGAAVSGGTGSTLTVQPSTTTSYWVRATNSCGAFANSETVTVTVLPCDAPAVLVAPVSGEAAMGESFTLSAVLTGTQPIVLQWYEGALGDTSSPVPNAAAATVTVGPITSNRSFWLLATNPCGEARLASVSVTVVSKCIAPVITQQPRDVNTIPGGSARVTVTATGTSLEYRWYEGRFDFRRPVGGSLPTLYISSVPSTTEYWVRISNSCGTVDSSVATVTTSISRRRSAPH